MSNDTETAPDLVLTRGKVLIADPARRPAEAEAVAVRGERITAVGTTEQVASLAGPGTRRIDLHGRVVITGINDAHTHQGPWPPFDAILEPKVSSPGWQDILDALAAAVAKVPRFARRGHGRVRDVRRPPRHPRGPG